MVGPNWTRPTFGGRIHTDGFTQSSGAGLLFSGALVGKILSIPGFFDHALNGSYHPTVETHYNGHGYNEDWLWKLTLLRSPDIVFYHLNTLHMHKPDHLINWPEWGAGDTEPHFPSAFHWIKTPEPKYLLQRCLSETKAQFWRKAEFQPKLGCDCSPVAPGAGSYCDLGSAYIRGYQKCAPGCKFLPTAAFNAFRNACVTHA